MRSRDWAAWGARVKALREQQDWTQQDLADQLRVARNTVARLETGGRRPSLELLERLAAEFSMTLDALLDAPRASRRRTPATKTTAR